MAGNSGIAAGWLISGLWFGGSAFSQATVVTAVPSFTAEVLQNFDAWDKNHDGPLLSEELDSVVSDAHVAAITDGDIALGSGSTGTGQWVAILDAAYGALHTASTGVGDVAIDTDSIAKGGSIAVAMRTPTGHAVARFRLRKPNVMPMPEEAEVAANLPTIRDEISAAFKDNRLLCAGTTDADRPAGITPRHAYAIIGFDPAADAVTLWNPHGQTLSRQRYQFRLCRQTVQLLSRPKGCRFPFSEPGTRPQFPHRHRNRGRLPMDAASVIAELSALGSESIKAVLIRHGAREPLFGVKVGDLKPLQKRLKQNYELSLKLYASGNSDAMYLAGLIADDSKMTADDLQLWVEGAYWSNLCEYTVPWVAAGSPVGLQVALAWIEDDRQNVACAGWSTISSIVSVTPDASLDLTLLESLLARVANTIHSERNRVRYSMNAFIAAVGGYVVPLTESALRTADSCGNIVVETGGTSCRVPSARVAIEKMQGRGAIGKKRKTARC